MGIGEKKGDVVREEQEFEGTDARLQVVETGGVGDYAFHVRLADSVGDWVILSLGDNRQDAVQRAVAALETMVEHLQGPPPIADITRRMLDR